MAEIDWRHLPPLSTLRAFEATARLQGYSAAARALNVTPAAIAQQVRKLEGAVGTSLVRREGRGLALTEAGRTLALPLREAFARIAEGVEEVRRLEGARGVRVSTTHFFGDAVILPRLGQFWTDHPGIQVSLAPEGNLTPVDLARFDIAVRGDNIRDTWQDVAVRPLLSTPMIVCAAPALLDREGGDLSRLPWLRDQGMPEAAWRAVMTRIGIPPDRVRLVDTGDAKFEVEAALMGYGMSLSTELVVRRHLEAGTLLWIDTPIDTTITYHAVHAKGPMAEPVRRFLDWLTAISRLLSWSGATRPARTWTPG